MKTLRQGCRGIEVRTLQDKLNLCVDGIFGPYTLEGVLEFQKNHGLTPDGIVGPATWGALFGVPFTPLRKIDKIIFHCTATPEGEDYTVDQIRSIHLQRGFSNIGYHWLVDRAGEIHAGRPESVSGAHTLGQNAHSIGVCYVGGCPPRSVDGWDKKAKDTRTPEQKDALIRLLKDLRTRYPEATIHSHFEFANKACPCFDAAKEYIGL